MSVSSAAKISRTPHLRTALLLMCVASGSVHAQDVALDEMQRNIEIFSGVIREGLDLNSRSGIFSPLNGSVRGTYFMRQGVVLEITSPLGSNRSGINWQSLENSLQQLSGQVSDFVSARVSSPDLSSMRESMALSVRAENARGAYAEFLEELRSTDFSEAMNQAMKEAADSARSLHQWGRIDDARLQQITEEAAQLRERFNARVQELTALRFEANAADATVPDESSLQTWRERLTELQASMEPLREAAVSRAQALMAQAEQAREEREQEWVASLAGFEGKLFELSCNYAAALQTLPDDEHVTLVLKGLGEQSGTRYQDRIHVLDKRDILSCQQGDISPAELQARASTYSY